MKNLKTILTLFIVLALMSGLFVKGVSRSKEISEQEFLFDTLCSITVYSKKDAQAVASAFEKAAQIHRLADFYDNRSDVSAINNSKAGTSITVAPDTMAMLMLANEISQRSDGAFDISIASISQLWKFSDQNSAPPEAAQIKAELFKVDSQALLLDEKTLSVTKKYDHTQIDLGGVAKGYAADKAKEVLETSGVSCALIDFGGNIVVLGENPNTQNKKWRIGLQKPYAPMGEYSDIIELEGGYAAVTSGTYQRYFEHNGKIYHHIIDPKIGYPANQPYNSVTVVAQTAVLADCLATAVFVAGETDGRRLASDYNAKVYFMQ